MSDESFVVYALGSNDNKYYVGRCDKFPLNIEDVKVSTKFKPIKIVEVVMTNDPFDEDKMVKKYMEKYGIDNVRGGSYKSTKLKKREIKVIRKEINYVSKGFSKILLRQLKNDAIIKAASKWFFL